MPTIEPIAEPGPEDREAILAPLEPGIRDRGLVWGKESLVLVLRDEAGRIVGGAIGEVHWGWLRVEILAVEVSLQGEGWGGRLMAELERLAIERGCGHAWVDTFSFQARPFYEKLGYRVFGTLPDYPAGHARYFLAKPLGEAG